MDSSPEAERILLPSVSAPSPPSSPPVQESPFFAFLRDLSPIRQTKALQYPQRFQPNKVPSPLPVFNSPHVDLRHQASFLEREKTDATGSGAYCQGDIQIKTQESPCFQKDDQSCSSPGFVDQYLADTAEEYSTNSSDPGSQADKVVPNILKGCRTRHKNTNMKADGANVIDTRARGLLSDQAGEPSASLHSVETTVLKGENERTNEFRKSDNERTKEFQDLASGFVDDPVESDMRVYHFPEVEYQEQFVAQAAGNQHYKPEANLQSIPESLRCVEAHKDPLGDSKPASTTSITKENNQLPRGIRRHLQFEAAKATGQANNETHDASNSSFSDAFMLEGLIPHDVQTKEIYGSWQVGSHVQSITPGLSSEPGQCEETMGTLQETDIGEDSAQMSPKRQRKKAKCTIDIEGCKRCNCKRSKCLKLYCECFAAGVYCLDTCACENCFNKPEYEDTVLDTRQQIETRNPLAFAPKVVKPPFNSPANMSDLQEGETWTTPSSARHKRGCNCKKSKCLKRYCECYQARVGCSDGCRCEGCGNSYGKKTELRYKRAERWENPSYKHLDAFKAQSETAKLSSPAWEDISDASHLTPSSPLPSSGLASSASLNKTDCSKISLAQWDHGSSLHPSDGYLTFNHSDASLTPALHGSKDLPEFSSDSLFRDILREADTPGQFKNASTPSKVVVAISPNGKRVSPPQIRSRELRSSSPQELKSGRKLILQSLRSFPSLTPYSKVDGASRLSDDDKGGNSCS